MRGSDRLQEYQRNAAFVAVTLVIAFAALVFLTKSLSNVLSPLIWSAFFAVPLTGLISALNDGFARLGCWCVQRINGEPTSSGCLEFTTAEGQSAVCVRGAPEAVAKLRGAVALPSCAAHAGRRLARDLRARVRVSGLSCSTVASDSEVNRIVDGWSYYAAVRSGEGQELWLEFFLDPRAEYPAVIAVPGTTSVTTTGTLELDRTSAVSWTLAFFAALAIMFAGVVIFVVCILLGVKAFQNNLHTYEQGFMDFFNSAFGYLKMIFPKDAFQELQKEADEFSKSVLETIAYSMASSFRSVGWECLLFVIYLLFWICEPLPVNNSVAQVVKSYLLLKTFVCLIFASLMAGLLYLLQCPLWHIFFVVTFLLSYIPEVGAIASAFLTIPAVLFDGNLAQVQRQYNTVVLIIFGILFKVVTGNVIELRLYATRGGSHMRMHPVVMIATMMLCEALLGITGMFLAVPIMAAVKYYLVSSDMPQCLQNPILVFLEGDEAGPHRNFVDRWRAGYGAVDPAGKLKAGP